MKVHHSPFSDHFLLNFKIEIQSASLKEEAMSKTLYEKIYDAHVAVAAEGENPILYIDRHLVHEVTSPQAFDGLREKGRKVRQVNKTFATMDHNVSTQTKTSMPPAKWLVSKWKRCPRTVKNSASRFTTSIINTKALCMSWVQSLVSRFLQ